MLSDLGEASGQQSDLVQALRRILYEYATGNPVLKELLQNSDDAGARKFVICLDKRRHLAKQLADPGLVNYIGPGILFFNDANFNESDWEAILNIGKSSKREDTLKTGNFGVGFCSVFNVTDLPSIISGTRLQLLDPLRSLDFVKNNASEPGVRIQFGKPESANISLFDPYRQFCKFDPACSFDGTIIRLPLRESPSGISQNTYTVELIQTQFRQFAEEASQFLLFLRCLKHIQVMEWDENATHPTLLYEYSAEDEPLQGSSDEFYECVKVYDWDNKDLTSCAKYDLQKKIQFRHANGESNVETWLVCSSLLPPCHIPKELQPKSNSFRKKLIPLAGIATSTALSLESEHGRVKGKVYCSLPLPINTHLPVHVNARFSITEDRTGISRDNGEKESWNKALLSIALPETYLRLLTLLPADNVFPLFPVTITDEFSALLPALYQLLPDSSAKLAPVTMSGEATCKDLRAVLLLNSDDSSKHIAEILGQHQIPACIVPHKILDLLQRYCPNLSFATPRIIRNHFADGVFSVEDALFVLQHFCGDITDNVEVLYDLYLLPTASQKEDGAIAKFGPPTPHWYFYCEDSSLYDLLCRYESTAQCLISNRVPEELVKCLLRSGNINVKKIDSSDVATLVSSLMPQPSNDTITVDLALCDWIMCLWHSYLMNLPKLQDFENLFLLPSIRDEMSVVMCKITPNSRFFVRQTATESLSLELVIVMEQLGCKEVLLDRQSVHHDLFASHYVSAPNSNSMLVALHSAGHIHEKFALCSDEGRCKLLSFLSTLNTRNVTSDHLSMLQHLPIFRNYNGSFTTTTGYIAPPVKEVSVDLLHGLPDILDVPAEGVSLAHLLGVKDISTIEFYTKFVFPRIHEISPSVRDIAMIKLVRKLPEIDGTVKSALRQLAFVPTISGNLGPPEDLYDPQEPLLTDLLIASSFPSSVYADDDILVYLRQLGLQKVLSRGSLLTLSEKITSHKQARAFLAYVNRHHATIAVDSSLVMHLASYPWMPVLDVHKLQCPTFPHRSDDSLIQRPDQTRAAADKSLISSKYFILDGTLDSSLQKAFMWEAATTDVFEQLVTLTQVSANSEEIEDIAESIYAYFDKQSKSLSPKFIEKLRALKFVFIRESSEFVAPSCLTFSTLFPSVRPYLLTVPERYSKFKGLWHMCEVSDALTPDQLLDLLEWIQKSEHTEATVSMAVAIVNHLAELAPLSPQQKERVVVPTLKNTLANPLLCVGDLEKGLPLYLQQAGYSELHPRVSIWAAKEFGVKSLGTAALESKKSNSKRWSFGQHTSLLNSINTIIKDYPEFSVLLELIQNADDAGATEICFLHDQRQHPTEKLFDPTMKELQGESLLVYNNKPFSPADYDNIVQVAAASKANDPKKTGRFGVGFVSTYHLSDTPSFVSQDQFCIFDPLQIYVPDATPKHPGVRCTLDPSFVSDFADQFIPFNVFECIPGQSFGGTIFRFALRKKLSGLKASIVDITKLLRALEDSSVLLFLKNITKLTVSQYQTNGSSPQVLFEISKTVQHISSPLRLVDELTPNLVKTLITSNSVIFAKSITEETILITKDETTTQHKWLVSSNIGAHEDLVLFLQNHTGRKSVPLGGVAVPVGSILSSAQAFCFLPLNVTVPFAVSINGFFDIPSNRQAIIGHQSCNSADESSVWNKLLIQHVIAPAYVTLLEEAAKLLAQHSVNKEWYTSLFPNVSSGDGFWSLLAESIFKLIGNQKLIPVDVGGGTHVVEASFALYGHYTLPAEVVDFVHTGDFAFCTLPFTVSERIPGLRKFNAAMCCDLLRKYVEHGMVEVSYEKAKLVNEEQVLALFSFCFAGCGNIEDIVGLPLLPLASGNIGVVGRDRETRFLYSQSDLLPNRKDLFLTPSAVNRLSATDISERHRAMFGLQYMDCSKLEPYLACFLPNSWKGAALVEWDGVFPSREWLDNIWKLMNTHSDYTTFQEWPLVPTNNGLVKLKNRKSVLVFDVTDPNPLHELLQLAGCNIFSPIGGNIRANSLSTPHDAGSVCRALEASKGIEDYLFKPHEADELRKCLKYATVKCLPVVKLLRIFPDSKGNLVAIGTRQWIAVMPAMKTEIVDHTFLIQSDDACKHLYILCDIPILTVPEGYNYILQNWRRLCANLTPAKRFECLDTIRKSIMVEQTSNIQSHVVDATIILLKSIACVESDKEGEPPKRAAEMYNPRQEIYAAAFEPGEGQFPASEYASTEWISFLIQIGLMDSPLSAPQTAIERCAEAICEKITLLFQEFTPNDDSPEFCTRLNTVRSRAKIFMKFVATEARISQKLRTLEYAVIDREATYLPGYLRSKYFTSYERAVPKECVEWVWLVAPALIDDGYSHSLLKRPSAAQIIENLLKFCTSAIDWTHDALQNGRLAEVLNSIYQELNRQYQTESANKKLWAHLSNKKWILVEERNYPIFASPTEVFGDISESYAGYFYKMPLHPSKKFLKQLGMKEQPSYQQICGALQVRKQELNDTPLDPNEFKTVRKLLDYLATLEIPEGQITVYAPDTDRVLQDISQLVINDTPAICSNIDNNIGQIKFLCKLHEKKARKLGAKSLAEAVKITTDLDKLGEKTINDEYTKKISSVEFENCVVRIVSFEHQKAALRDTSYIDQVKSLRAVKVMNCQTIVNQYTYNGVNISKDGSQKPLSSTVDVKSLEIYLSSQCDREDVAVELAEHINTIIGHIVKETMLIRLLQSKGDLNQVCDDFNIPVVTVPKQAIIGDILTQPDQLRIRENIMYTFEPKEYVAWFDGTSHRYGRINAVNDSITSTGSNYKVIITTRYEVAVGSQFGKTRNMGVMDLYKLRTPNDEGHEEDDSENLLMEFISEGTCDEYFSQDTPEAREKIAQRVFKATTNNERFKATSGVVESFVSRQLDVQLSQSYNNNNNNNYNSGRSLEAIIQQQRLLHTWKQEVAYKCYAQQDYYTMNLKFAQRSMTQVTNDKEILLFLQAGNSTGNMSDHVCFLAQQVLEKSLKAALECTPHPDLWHSHRVRQIVSYCEEILQNNTTICKAVNVLEGYYIPTRYLEHHDFPLVTRDAFTKEQADEAVKHSVRAADIILAYVQQKLTL